jgi:type IV secretion system protein TrbC
MTPTVPNNPSPAMAALKRAAPIAALALVIAFPAHAAGSGMPWEGPLEQIVDSITGPVARAAAVIAIVLAGITIMFSEGGSGVRKLAFVGLGIAVMFAAVSFFLDFFGFAGGAVL